MDTGIHNSGRVSLQEPRFQDMGFIRQLWSDQDTMASVGGPVYISNDASITWFERKIDPGNPEDCYRLILDPGGRPIGEVSFHRLDPQSMTAALNIKIMASARGKGYATQALQLFLDYFFNELGGQILIDDLAIQNVTGQAFLHNFGFEDFPSSNAVRRFKMTKRMFKAIGEEHSQT